MRRVLITNFGQSALSTAETLAFQTADITAHVSQSTHSLTEESQAANEESSSEGTQQPHSTESDPGTPSSSELNTRSV